jgi:hypothetical protein
VILGISPRNGRRCPSALFQQYLCPKLFHMIPNTKHVFVGRYSDAIWRHGNRV